MSSINITDIIILSMGKTAWNGSGDESPREGVKGVVD
jgi:hypothetical protein